MMGRTSVTRCQPARPPSPQECPGADRLRHERGPRIPGAVPHPPYPPSPPHKRRGRGRFFLYGGVRGRQSRPRTPPLFGFPAPAAAGAGSGVGVPRQAMPSCYERRGLSAPEPQEWKRIRAGPQAAGELVEGPRFGFLGAYLENARSSIGDCFVPTAQAPQESARKDDRGVHRGRAGKELAGGRELTGALYAALKPTLFPLQEYRKMREECKSIRHRGVVRRGAGPSALPTGPRQAASQGRQSRR